MSPATLLEIAEVYHRQQEKEWERAAWMVHHIMAAFIGSKATPSINRLLGRTTDGDK